VGHRRFDPAPGIDFIEQQLEGITGRDGYLHRLSRSSISAIEQLADCRNPRSLVLRFQRQASKLDDSLRSIRFVSSLSIGEVPDDIVRAFPSGVSDAQRQNSIRAKQSLDELVCTTIHGFAQVLIKPYPAEAGIDPGAEIVDPTEGDLAFNERYLNWIKEHLSGERDDDIIAELVIADEFRGLRLIRSIADFLRKNRDARLPNHTWSSSLAKKLSVAVAALEKEIGQLEFQEEQTSQACAAFIEMAEVLRSLNLLATEPCNRALVQAATIPRHVACFTQAGGKRQLRTKGVWERAAAVAGKSKAHGTMAFQACAARYDACHEALSELMTMVVGELLARTVIAMDRLFAEWREYKRSAALLDFDDLLHTAEELLAKNEHVRKALGKRYQHVLVDEFQDTDPLQLEILWHLCGDHPNDEDGDALTRVLRRGSLFLVGDPKQAIYRFRGADINAYLRAREAIGGPSVVNIVANFRSVEPILSFVNGAFAGPLSTAAGQPGFTALAATRLPEKNALAAAALDVVVEDGEDSAELLRDAEADRVAELCSRMVGNLKIRENGELRPCRFGDIALLAPVGTDLWRFEEALEKCGIPVSTQAGKGFFRRQEIQDLIALTRAIADARDTLALGALLRGPLVGLSETELLDIADGIPTDPECPDHLPNLSLWTELEKINHELARDVIKILQSLARRVRSNTPYALLSDAVSLLNLRAHFRHRFPASADRVLANLDLFLEMSRAYDVRGLRAFARDMRANWEEQVLQVEGRPDAEEQSVALITIHAAKGLEWPIVIPINMTGAPKSETGLMHDRRSGEFSTLVLGIEPAGYAQLKSWNELELARERVRLWYVAATRARDLLILPRHSAQLSDKSWARLVDLGLPALPAIEPTDLGTEIATLSVPEENKQSADLFREQAGKISEAYHTIIWNRPSRHEVETPQQLEGERIFSDPELVDELVEPIEVLGSSTRGTVLHKLMEEVLTGETPDMPPELERRALELLSQLGVKASADPTVGISPVELASTVLKTLALAEIGALRPHLVPEQSVFGHMPKGEPEMLVSGIADAIAQDASGCIEVILDWKSDPEVSSERLAAYKAQLSTYRDQTGAKQALLVLMTHGTVLGV
jgi:exodeoxyribonuclease-5